MFAPVNWWFIALL